MYAKKCDRCGDFYVPGFHTGPNPYYVVIKRLKNGRNFEQDFCPDCESFLTAWIESGTGKAEAENAGES